MTAASVSGGKSSSPYHPGRSAYGRRIAAPRSTGVPSRMYLTPETPSVPPGLGPVARASATSRPPARVMGKRITRHRIGTSAARSSATARAVVSAVFMSCTVVMPKRAAAAA